MSAIRFRRSNRRFSSATKTLRSIRASSIACGVLLAAAVAPARAEDVPGAVPFSQGLDALGAGEWSAAVGRFSEALDADEDNAEYHLARGVARVLAEQFPEAQKDLNRAMRLGGQDFDAKLWLSASYFMANDPENGSLNLTYGRQETHAYTETVSNMARTYMDSRYRGSYLDRATRKRIQTSGPVRTGFGAAAAAFVERHRAAGAAASVTKDAALSALRRGDAGAALPEIERLLRQRPGDLSLLEQHAEASLGVGDVLSARFEYTQLLTVDPFVAARYVARARAAAGMGDVPRARADWDQARALDAELDKAGAASDLQAALTAATPPQPQIAAAREQLETLARDGAPWSEVVAAAEQLVRNQNCYRLRADETYQDRLRELLAATKTIPSSADSLAELGAFLFQEATHVRGEDVEPRAGHLTYRPATKESLADEMKRAEEALDAALAVRPEHVKALTYKAGCLMWRVRWDEAESVVRQALSLQPDSAELLLLLAQILDHAAGVKASKAASLRSVDTWSDMNYIYWRAPSQAELDQADVYDRQAEELWKMSAEHLAAAARAAAGTAMGSYLDGVIARRNKDADTARAAFEQTVQMDPAFQAAHDHLASIYADLGMTDKAHEQQSAANNLVHTTAGPMLRLAWLETARTARKAARSAARAAWALDGADPRCPAYLGVTELDAEKYDLATGYLRAALALVEVRARLRGQSLSPDAAGGLSDADLGQALALRQQLAQAYLGAGRANDADEVYRQILALDRRISGDQLRRPLTAALLPDPKGDPIRLPEADPPAAFLARAHIALGNGALERGNLDDAEGHFGAVTQLAGQWPFTLPGRECLNVSSSWARIGTVKVLAARGQTREALRLFRHEGWPGELPADLEQEIDRLEQTLTNRPGR